MELGEELTKTCHEFYSRQGTDIYHVVIVVSVMLFNPEIHFRSKTGIGPEIVDFNPVKAKENDFSAQNPTYLLRPGEAPLFLSFIKELNAKMSSP